MWIIIDTTQSGEVRLYYSYGTSWNEFAAPAADSLRVLHCLQSLLTQEKRSLTDLRGVGIVQKKGAFTATRVAATIANTLSYALQIPAIGITSAPASDPAELFADRHGRHFVTPEYSGEPSIGTKTKP